MKTLTIEQMELANGSANMEAIGKWGCNMGLGIAGAILSTAAGVATMGAGFAVAIGWAAFQTWACSKA